MIPYQLTNDQLTIVIAGEPKHFKPGSAQYAALRQALFAEDWTEAERLIKIPTAAIGAYLAQVPGFGIEADDSITFQGQPVPDEVAGRASKMAAAGEDPTPLLRFYERLLGNPSWRSVQQLYPFLNHAGIPIEPDGTFLAYKGVREDLRDKHSATFDNSPGRVHELPRNRISDDPNVACHFGFHVGALEYARGFASVVVICRVAPEDVVCIPHDCSQQKMRVCKYEVVGFWNGQGHLSSTTTNQGELEVEDEVDDGDADTGNDYYAEGDEQTDRGEKSSAAEDKIEPSAKRRNYRSPVGAAVVRKLTHMAPKALLSEATIDQLRAYAAKLKIVGASKIPGGKVGLISHITKARRARKSARSAGGK